MTILQAPCSCRQLCHCLECQKRDGSPFGVQARFRRAPVTIEGKAREFVRVGDEGNRITLRFCQSIGELAAQYGEGENRLLAIVFLSER